MKKRIRAIVQRLDSEGTVEHYETTVCGINEYYEELDCDLFDVVYWQVNGKEVSLFCDDEGMLKSGNFGRYILNENGEKLIPIFGNLLILGGVDEEGETLGLDDDITIEMVNKQVETYLVNGFRYATLIVK